MIEFVTEVTEAEYKSKFKPIKDTLYLALTHCGLVMPYGDMELGQHWLR